MPPIANVLLGPKDPDEEGIITDIYYNRIRYNNTFLKIYTDSLVHFAKLNHTQINLFLFMCLKSNDSNSINTDKSFRIDFNKHLGPKNSISDSNIKSGIQKLNENFFITQKVRGSYFINPLYFFRGRENTRKSAIIEFEKLSQKNFNKYTQKIIDRNLNF